MMTALEDPSRLHPPSTSRVVDKCTGRQSVGCSRARGRKRFAGVVVSSMVSQIRMMATSVVILLLSISSQRGALVQGRQSLLQRRNNTVVQPTAKECRDFVEQRKGAASTTQVRSHSRSTPFQLAREIECESRHYFSNRHRGDFESDEGGYSREGYLAQRTMQRHLAGAGGSPLANTVSIDANGAVAVFGEKRRLQNNTTNSTTDPASQQSENDLDSNQQSQEQQQEQQKKYAQERQALVSFYKATTGEQWTNRFGWDSIEYTEAEKDDTTTEEVNAEMIPGGEQRVVDTTVDSKEALSPSDIIGSSVAEPSYSNNNNTSSTDQPANTVAAMDFATHCTWYGVECDPDTKLVTSVVLIKNNLRGKLSSASELTGLRSLEVLALSENKLTGILPAFMGDFTESLTELYLRDNDFRGAIPSELQQLVQLKALVLSDNNFQGSIPSQVQDMKNLTKLDIGNNKLSGPFPWSLLVTGKGLPALTDLLLDGNAFTGTIVDLDAGVANGDKVVTTLSTGLLRQLHVARNRLTGRIPESLGREFASLRKLSLGSNALVGTIPPSIAEMSHMVGLDLSQNRLTGTVPHEVLRKMTKLQLLDLRQNLLSGELPIDFLLDEDESTESSSYSAKPDQEADNYVEANSNKDGIGNSTATLMNRTNSAADEGHSSSEQEPAKEHFSNRLQYLFFGGNEFTGTISSQAIRALSTASLLQILDLSDNDLTGVIPTSISEFAMLEQLLLSGNGFVGQIPSRIGNLKELSVLSLASNKLRGEIPTQIGSLTNLEVLHLSDNALNSTIPTEIGYLTELKTLVGSRNKFTGVLPTQELFQLMNLNSLLLDGNRFRGALPEPELGNLNQLRELNIAGNHFVGTLPFESLSKLKDLEYFDCRSNEFNGSLQFDVWGGDEIQQGRKLSTLRMSYNQFTGTLDGVGALGTALTILELQSNALQGFLPPQDLSALTSLKTLDLQGNRFSGTVPTQISDMISLAVLDLRDNDLTGPLPSLIVDNKNKSLSSSKLGETLERLYLANNSLEGTIGSNIGRLRALKEVQFQNNQFVGSLPVELQQLQQLRELHLEGNRLGSTLPPFLGTLRALRVLSLGQNQIRGNIPSQLGNLGDKLDHLSLKGNMLRGTIPSELGALSSLRILDVSNNKLMGELPITLSRMSSLRILDLSYNSLSGTMPGSMFSLVRLEELKLARNFFNGRLSPQFGDLVRMRNLDLSGNQFTGTLPPSFARMTMLRELRIANETSSALTNNAGQSSTTSVAAPSTRDGITGEIPIELGDLLSLQVLDVSGNCLQGNIPQELGRLIRLQSLDLSNNELTGYIPSEIGTISLPALDRLALDENEGLRSPAPLGLCGLNMAFDLAYDDDWCPEERNVLKQFYEQSVGRRWLNNTGWGGQYNNHCKTWHGITCNREGYVTHINLADNSLSGFVAEEIGLLRHLEELNVTQNRLGGTVPTEVGMLLHLTKLILSDNRLTGSLPKQLSRLKELQILDLSRNTLQEGIRFLPGNATSLQFLDISVNRLRGDIHQVLEPLLKLKNITEIHLTRNEFTGVVPAHASVSGLDALSLSGNILTSPIASRLCNSHPSFDLDLKRSSSHCPGKQAFLEELYNATKGEAWINNARWLSTTDSVCEWYGITCDNKTNVITRLDLRENGLDGTLPSGLKFLDGLRYLDMAGNKLISTIPHDLWSLKSLKLLNLNSNRLTGKLPPFVGKSGQLSTILLKNNRLTGPIPPEIGELSHLRQVELANNSFTGQIPAGFDTQNLTGGIKLKNNSLSGSPPGKLCQNPNFDLRSEIAWCPANLYDEWKIVLVVILFIAPLYFIMFVHFLYKSYFSREMNITMDWFKWWLGLKEISPAEDPNVHAVEEEELSESSIEDVPVPGVSPRNLNIFAGIMLSLQLICSILGGFVALTQGVVEVSITFGGLLGWTFGLLSWASSLAPSCSKWFLRISLIILPPATFLGLFAQFFYKSFLVYTAMLYFAWSIPTLLVARTFQNLVTADLKEPEMLMLSIEMVKRFTAALPAMFFFAMRAFQAFQKANEREYGVDSFHENHVEGWVSLFSGLTILLTFVSSEVFNLAKLSISDIVSFRLRLWEITALASNTALIALALYMETLVSYIDEKIAITVICAMFVGPAFQVLSLWCVARDVFHNNHPFMQERTLHIADTFVGSDGGNMTQKADIMEMGGGAVQPAQLSAGKDSRFDLARIRAKERAARSTGAGVTCASESDGSQGGLSFRMAGGSRKLDLASLCSRPESLSTMEPPQAGFVLQHSDNIHFELAEYIDKEKKKVKNNLKKWMEDHQEIIMGEADAKLQELDAIIAEQKLKNDELGSVLESLKGMGI